MLLWKPPLLAVCPAQLARSPSCAHSAERWLWVMAEMHCGSHVYQKVLGLHPELLT